MKTIELYLIKTQGFTKDYIDKNVVSYSELRAKDWETGIIYQLSEQNTNNKTA